MTQQNPELAVLTERVQNLINRVDVGFSEAKVRTESAQLEAKAAAEAQRRETENNRTELHAVKEEVQRLTANVLELREDFNEHVLEDTAVQKTFGAHLNQVDADEAFASGRRQVLSFMDKLMIRGLSAGGSLLLLYEGITKLHH